jgi:hypothetical protein
VEQHAVLRHFKSLRHAGEKNVHAKSSRILARTTFNFSSFTLPAA